MFQLLCCSFYLRALIWKYFVDVESPLWRSIVVAPEEEDWKPQHHQFLKKLAFLQQAGEHDTEAVVKTCILIYKPKSTIFPSQITNEHESLVMVKKLFATSISCITYLRGLFPESSYRDRHLDDLSLKILREDKKCPGSLHIIKWIQGCFDALEKRYLHMAVLTLYTNPKEPEKVTEIYQFKFKYTKKGTTMDFDSSSTSFESGTNSEDIKKACSLLIRQLYILMQNLGPLPNDVILTMKLHYYNSVTPYDYQPPGFKEGVNSHFLLFDGEPVSLRMGSVSSGFHSMKVKVTTEATRMLDGDNSPAPETGTTEIAHQGLDCDEEEEDSSNQTQRMNCVHIEPSFESSGKKRKISEPVKVFIHNRK